MRCQSVGQVQWQQQSNLKKNYEKKWNYQSVADDVMHADDTRFGGDRQGAPWHLSVTWSAARWPAGVGSQVSVYAVEFAHQNSTRLRLIWQNKERTNELDRSIDIGSHALAWRQQQQQSSSSSTKERREQCNSIPYEVKITVSRGEELNWKLDRFSPAAF